MRKQRLCDKDRSNFGKRVNNMKYSLRCNGNIEVIDISEESVPFCVGLLNAIDKLIGQHIEMYQEENV